MATAARSVIADRDAGRWVDPARVRWAEHVLTTVPGAAPVVAAGQHWCRLGRTARVLGVLEGYVVFRFKRATPGVMHWRDFESNFVAAAATPAVKEKK